MLRPLVFLVFAASLSMGCSLALDFDPFREEGSPDAGGSDGSLSDGSLSDGSLSDASQADASIDAGVDATPPCEASVETCNMLDDDCDNIIDEGGYDARNCVDACGQGPDGGSPVRCESNEICVAGRCGERPVFMAAGSSHSCVATQRSGRLYCWGNNSHGQAGGGDAPRVLVPTRPPSPAHVTRHVGAGAHHTCAVEWRFGSPLCWGDNSAGQLGGVAGDLIRAPTPVPEVTGALSAFGGGDTTCFSAGETNTGPLLCSGVNRAGQIGDGTMEDHRSFVSGAGGARMSRYQVSMGASHLCAIGDNDGTPALFCWGDNGYGQVGVSGMMSYSSPVAVPGTEAVSFVAAGTSHTCAVIATQVWCWGRNDRGQLGIPMSGDASSPAPVMIESAEGEPSAVVTTVAVGEAHSCAGLRDGRVFCWGQNDHGQLGDETRAARSTPVQVAFRELDEVIALIAGDRHTCASTTRGLLFCWGDNEDGQLGIGVAGGIYTTPRRVSGAL